MSAIGFKIDEPLVFDVEGGGVVEYFEFEKTIWVQNVWAEKRGHGLKAMKRFIAYARSVGKDIYGNINVEPGGLTNEQLERLYTHFGAVKITMDENFPLIQGKMRAMMLEV